MVTGTSTVLEPTFTGYVATTQDALVLFEACLTGVLHHVPRRPHDRERSHLVRSGSVFIYEENSSGIKRWTDGVTWSPSRILGNFLVYRELEKPFPPGEKKRAMKKTTRRPPLPSGRPGEPYPRQEPTTNGYSPSPTAETYDRPQQSDLQRALVGSLVDSYGFKDAGLVKKTMSVTVSGVTHHLVSYYSVEDVMRGALLPPSHVEVLKFVRPRNELVHKQSFRAPIDEMDPQTLENPNDPTHYSYRTQMMAAASYPMQNPHAEFYMQNTYVPATTHASQSTALSGYALPGSIQNQHSFLPTPTAPAQIPHAPKQEDYSQFRQHSYGTAFDALGQGPLSSSIQSSIPGSLPSSISERARSQSDQSQAAYRNSSISSRSITTDTTSPIDPSTPATYSQRSSFSLAGQLDPTAHSPLDHRTLSFDAAVPRRESNPVGTHFYARNEQQQHPYYINATAPANHPSYPVSAAWSTTSAQPQI
ncbi:Gti1/Pac2 family-domain-containing protein [Aspergillus pseudoustus]|uniref:Gti1/Pac2 family-domain-containing protein n=1 Tax=Aspergillus pseudoustus TaxID=1810923 RepID=A0ABR4KT41_9EURO